MDSPAANTRSRASKLARESSSSTPTTLSPAPGMSFPTRGSSSSLAPDANAKRNPPWLPTRLESIVLILFPALLVFGTVFSALSPQTRAAPYDPAARAHVQTAEAAPSYFARKSNLFNVLFVKKGWAWTTFAFGLFLLTHPFHGARFSLTPTPRRLQALLRWAILTSWWFLVTQWFFGPALIDRGFRWTGGKCEMIEEKVEMGLGSKREVVSGVACKAAGGRWSGGHDISGHVFLLVLASGFLLQEVGWVAARWMKGRKEERSIVMTDGAVKSASVEVLERDEVRAVDETIGLGGRVALSVVGLSCWMLLMTAIYFHTWFEKLTGLLCALVPLYAVYVLPRFVPALRQAVGLPGL